METKPGDEHKRVPRGDAAGDLTPGTRRLVPGLAASSWRPVAARRGALDLPFERAALRREGKDRLDAIEVGALEAGLLEIVAGQDLRIGADDRRRLLPFLQRLVIAS